jgi:hypothetical protein
MKVGMRIPVIDDSDCDSRAIKEKLKQWRSFSQYTDVEALMCILKNRELKANCLKNVDDLKEQTYLQPLIDNDEALPYVSCFDHNKEENIPLWNMYSDDKYGVRIQFTIPQSTKDFHELLIDSKRFVKGCRSGADPINFRPKFATDFDMSYPYVWVHMATMPINYKNNLQIAAYQLPASNLINWKTLASVKSEDWKFQNEVRIVADFQNTGPEINDSDKITEIPYFDYLLLPIRFSELEKIVITFSPWMQEQTKQMVSESIKQLNLDCECIVENSQLDKLIRR